MLEEQIKKLGLAGQIGVVGTGLFATWAILSIVKHRDVFETVDDIPPPPPIPPDTQPQSESPMPRPKSY